MEIDQSSLFPEVQRVLQGGPTPVHFTWRAVIHINELQLDFPVLKVIELDNVSDFESNFTDEITIKVLIPAGTFATQIYPFQNDLDMTVLQYPLGELADASDGTHAVNAVRYQATLDDKGNPLLQANSRTNVSQESLDLSQLLEVTFQLIDKSLEQVRMMSVGGRWLQVKVEDFIKAAMTQFSQNVDVDQTLKVQGVDMVPASNKNVRDHIVIPHGTRLIDVPAYVQERCGGIYSAGLGCYLRNKFWYIYPCYDTTRYNQALKTATVILLPQNRYSNLERTYRVDGDHLVILATGDIQFRGDSTPQQLNFGNGVRYTDASKVMEGIALTKDNKTVMARGNNTNEYVNVDRPNGLNNVQMAANPITANPFAQASRLARRNGSVVAFNWENSNDSLLTPSMMLNILYFENDQVKSLTGVLLKTHTYVQMNGVGITSSRHISRTGMSCFVQNTTP